MPGARPAKAAHSPDTRKQPPDDAPLNPGEAVVETHNLRRTYPGSRRTRPTVALDGVSITIRAGEHAAILGANGSGKSTLLRILAGADRADSGALRIFAHDPATLPPRHARALRARIGVVFQRPGLDPLLTVRENLLAQASLFGITGPTARDRIERAPGAVELSKRLDSRVGALSGGLARRADLARALLQQPDLLLLDEPTAGLDPRARTEFAAAVNETTAARAQSDPLTIITSTHLMDEASSADRIVLMHAGRIIADDTPHNLLSRAGRTLIRCEPEPDETRRRLAAELLRETGMQPINADQARENERVGLLARAPEDSPDAVERAAATLARAGIAFSVGPPTLESAYLSLTGASLTEQRGDP